MTPMAVAAWSARGCGSGTEFVLGVCCSKANHTLEPGIRVISEEPCVVVGAPATRYELARSSGSQP
jgi:hypothetical protein